MVTGYDVVLLVVGIFLGRVVFSPGLKIGFWTRFFCCFPTYDASWYEINKLFHITKVVIADPAAIVVFFLGVGIICGAPLTTASNMYRTARAAATAGVGGSLITRLRNGLLNRQMALQGAFFIFMTWFAAAGLSNAVHLETGLGNVTALNPAAPVAVTGLNPAIGSD